MKKILVLNLFPTANPPVTGGQIRYFHIYQKLSRYYDITLLSQSHRAETVEFSPTFREHRVPRDPRHRRITAALEKELQCDRSGYELNLIKNIKLSNYPTTYQKEYDALYQASDIIIHETPYMLGYDRHLGSDQKLRIYNSHNHDFLLAKQIWKNERAGKYLRLVYELEKKLARHADLVFATSEDERNSFISMYNLNPGKVKLAPNGINPEEWLLNRNKTGEKTVALFIGANYPPNIEAVDYLVNHLADRCPEVQFAVAGGCCSPFKNQDKTNVRLLGKISDTKKRQLFARADLAVNPIVSGGGINLKTLEFLSAGIPLFSTAFGTRGLKLVDGIHYIKADMTNFSIKIREFCHQEQRLKEIASCGQSYVNDNYSWRKIASDIKKHIEESLVQRGRPG